MEAREDERMEEQKVIEARMREREEEIRRDQEREAQRLAAPAAAAAAEATAAAAASSPASVPAPGADAMPAAASCMVEEAPQVVSLAQLDSRTLALAQQQLAATASRAPPREAGAARRAAGHAPGAGPAPQQGTAAAAAAGAGATGALRQASRRDGTQPTHRVSV